MEESQDLIEKAVTGGVEDRRKLFEIVYSDLKRIAQGKLAAERADHSLSATALVHEVYLRLGDKSFGENSTHLLRSAAIAMRSILIDGARRKAALKRGRNLSRTPLDPDSLPQEIVTQDLGEIDDALQKLREVNDQAADVVQMRFFCGMRWGQIAECLGVSEEKVTSLWNYGRAKLRVLLDDIRA